MMHITEERMAGIIKNSYKDFHVKGFDYICLERSPSITEKLYFFDGNISQMPEVVHPHNHRYDFSTYVLRGASTNSIYTLPVKDEGEVYQVFRYLTPLNGGKGFTWERECQLVKQCETLYEEGPITRITPSMYTMLAEEIHTIRIMKEGTILRLLQYEDVIPIGEPTFTFTKSKEPISLSGLYNKFTADEILKRLRPLPEFDDYDFSAQERKEYGHLF